MGEYGFVVHACVCVSNVGEQGEEKYREEGGGVHREQILVWE